MRNRPSDGNTRVVSTVPQAPRVARPLSGRIIAGVARGLAEHLNLPVWLVRLAFVVLTLAGGLGIVLYGAFWVVLPQSVDAVESSNPADADAGDQTDLSAMRLLSVVALGAGALLLLAALGVDVWNGSLLPALLAIGGAVLVWQQADADQRAQWSASATRVARQGAGSAAGVGRWRIITGIALVVVGLLGILVNRAGPAAALQALATAVLLVGGVALVVFPWIYRKWRDQAEQRRQFIRSQERADVAAHVHDSVLQTLTLIQRNASDPAEVARLARAEERALRSWLYAPTGDPMRTFAARLQLDAAEVEQAYAATLDVVIVGDIEIDKEIAVLLAATREAMVNAARHGGGTAAVYAEVGEGSVEVFVRDRGPGFDLSAIPSDRHGIRESIIGRMERNGGSAEVVSRVGAGTEIRLSMPSRTGEAA